MPIINNFNLIFIHIPKTGGSSINEYFKLNRLITNTSVQGNFPCELKLPGFIKSTYGNNYVMTTNDLRQYISKGDYIRIGDLLYQIHSKKELSPNKIYLACIDNARNIMKGCIAETEGLYIGDNSKKSVYKKLVSNVKGDRIIPSVHNWGWITTKKQNNEALIQVYNNGIIRKSGNPTVELDHTSISYIRSRIPVSKFNNMFKFAFIRNPYSRLVSEYFWKRKDADIRYNIDCRYISFTDFIYTLQKKFDKLLNQPHAEVSHYLPQYLFICDDYDNIIVDYVAKYEDGLETGLEIAFDKLNIPISKPIILPKHNVTSTKRQHYSSYYTSETAEIVADLYKKDFELFNYSKNIEFE